jgi:uncharacterized protein (TIGR03086 family)
MSEISERYATIADGFDTRLVGVGPDQWSNPTPCTDWTLRDLVTHVINTHRRVVSNVDAGEVIEMDKEGDLLGAFAAARASVEAALNDPARSSKVTNGMFGEQTFESLVGRLLSSDTLVHTWDLARATGQDPRLDPEAVAKAAEFLSPIDEAIRRPGGFAAKIAPPDGADSQTQLMNFCGRAV